MFELVIGSFIIIYLLIVCSNLYKKNIKQSNTIYQFLITDLKKVQELRKKFNLASNKMQFLKYLRTDYNLTIKDAQKLINILRNDKNNL